MKRHDALAALSRDHHQGLVVAQRLVRATEVTAAEAREAFLQFWDHDGHQHLGIEEDVLLPAVAHRIAPRDEAVVRVLTDHVDIRRQASDLAADIAPAPSALHDLGGRLRDHIRHEERVLFVMIEQALSERELTDLLAAIDDAHG